jgi:hypothetical protein
LGEVFCLLLDPPISQEPGSKIALNRHSLVREGLLFSVEIVRIGEGDTEPEAGKT